MDHTARTDPVLHAYTKRGGSSGGVQKAGATVALDMSFFHTRQAGVLMYNDLIGYKLWSVSTWFGNGMFRVLQT